MFKKSIFVRKWTLNFTLKNSNFDVINGYIYTTEFAEAQNHGALLLKHQLQILYASDFTSRHQKNKGDTFGCIQQIWGKGFVRNQKSAFFWTENTRLRFCFWGCRSCNFIPVKWRSFKTSMLQTFPFQFAFSKLHEKGWKLSEACQNRRLRNHNCCPRHRRRRKKTYFILPSSTWRLLLPPRVGSKSPAAFYILQKSGTFLILKFLQFLLPPSGTPPPAMVSRQFFIQRCKPWLFPIKLWPPFNLRRHVNKII